MNSHDAFFDIRDAYNKISPADLNLMGCTYGNTDELSLQAATVASLWMK